MFHPALGSSHFESFLYLSTQVVRLGCLCNQHFFLLASVLDLNSCCSAVSFAPSASLLWYLGPDFSNSGLPSFLVRYHRTFQLVAIWRLTGSAWETRGKLAGPSTNFCCYSIKKENLLWQCFFHDSDRRSRKLKASCITHAAMAR